MSRPAFNLIIAAVLSIPQPLYAQDSTIVISPDLELVRLSAASYLHVSYQEIDGQRIAANGLVYLNGGQAFIADTPWTVELTDTLIDWLEHDWRVEVTAVAATHWHEDCMGGIEAAVRRGITTYGQTQTVTIGREKGLVTPETTFEDTLSVPFGAAVIELAYFGGGHTLDNYAVWIPSEKILFAGDLLRTTNANSLGNTDDAVPGDWPATLTAAREAFSGAKIVIPGHGPYGGLELFDHTLALLGQREK